MKKILLLILFTVSSYFGFAQADIKVLNTNFQTKYVAGTEVIYSISIVNSGPAPATNVNVSSIISTGINQKAWTGPVVPPATINSNGTGEINHVIPTLLPGETKNYMMVIEIPLGFTGNLNCKVTATSITPDPDLSNNEVNDLDTKGIDADISVTNTNNQVIYTPGTTTTYTVTVKNNGPLNAGGVAVSNVIPTGITNYSWTGSNGSSGTNVPLNNTIGSLFVGQTITYTITAVIPPGFFGNLTNTVSVTSISADNNSSNNTATDVDVTNSGANLVVVNTDGATTYAPGTQKIYTVTVTNNGPSAATNVVVTNAIPVGITSFSWTGSNGSSGTNIPLNDTLPTLANGATVTYTITLDIPNNFIGNLVSEANASSDTPDLFPECPQCIDINTLQNVTDIMITNTNNQQSYFPGATSIYTVTVRNNGPRIATNVLVNSAIPAGITNFSWTGNAANGTNTALNNTISSLLPGQSMVYTITMQIPLSFTGNLVSIATANSSLTDNNTANNTATDTDTQGDEADVVITNTNDQLLYIPGGTSVYTVTVTNNGPLNATNILVQNAIPAGITNFSWTGNGATGTDVNLNNTIVSLQPGQSRVYTITMQIPPTLTGDLVSTATANSSIPDNTPANNTASDTDTLAEEADVVITNTNNQVSYIPGGTSVYIITVTNNGPLNATNVLVQNAIPAGIINFSWTGNGATGTDVNLNNTILNLASGESVVYTVTMQIPLTLTGDLVSTATANSPVADTTTANNTAVDTDTLGTGADIVVTNTNNQTVFTEGANSVYTITVTNNGPSDAVNVVVNNPLPAGIITSSWTGDNGTSGTNADLVDTIPLFTVGTTITYTFTMAIPVGQTDDVVSVVSITSTTPDPNPACEACTDTDVAPEVIVVPDPSADLVTTITDGFTTYRAGQSRTYTITITNNGPTDAQNVLVQGNVSSGIDPTTIIWSGNGNGNTLGYLN